MPYKSKRPCSQDGCPKLIPSGQLYCEEHKKLHPELIRSAAKRGYNYRWRVESKKYLKEHPLCVKCLADGRATEATVVDHIVPHRGDMTLFWDRRNWQSLCKHCHDVKTATEERFKEYHY